MIQNQEVHVHDISSEAPKSDSETKKDKANGK